MIRIITLLLAAGISVTTAFAQDRTMVVYLPSAPTGVRHARGRGHFPGRRAHIGANRDAHRAESLPTRGGCGGIRGQLAG